MKKSMVSHISGIAIIFGLLLIPTSVLAVEADSYESDNFFEDAGIIVIGAEAQQHNFHELEDTDWVKFFALSAVKKYSIEARNPGTDTDIILELYDTDGVTSLELKDTMGDTRADEIIEYTFPQDGVYYVKVSRYEPSASEDAGYDLKVRIPTAPVQARFEGVAVDAFSQNPLGDVMIRTTENYTALSEQDGGNFVMYHAPLETDSDTVSVENDAVTLTAFVQGYVAFGRQVFMIGNDFMVMPGTESEDAGNTPRRSLREIRDTVVDRATLIKWESIQLIPSIVGDIDGDGSTDRTDAITVLQVITGQQPSEKIQLNYADSNADVNGDGKLGLAEAVYIMRKLAGI